MAHDLVGRASISGDHVMVFQRPDGDLEQSSAHLLVSLLRLPFGYVAALLGYFLKSFIRARIVVEFALERLNKQFLVAIGTHAIADPSAAVVTVAHYSSPFCAAPLTGERAAR